MPPAENETEDRPPGRGRRYRGTRRRDPPRAAAKAGGLPVTLSVTAPTAPRASGAAAKSAPHPATGALTAKVSMAPQSTSAKLALRGVVFGLQRTDLTAGARTARVSLDYSAFRNAYGADWGSRLRLVQLPACALTTPALAKCRTQTPLATSTNSGAGNQVTAQVQLAARSAAVQPMTVLAATSSETGSGGSFAATSLAPQGQWSGGSGAGSFNWSYNVSIPEVPGGLAPTVSLGYDSQSIDGRTAADSPQASWVGDGWSDSQNYIERSYVSCSQDSNSTNNTPKTGDECWSDAADSVTLSLNGTSTTLVHDDATGAWRPQNDNGETVSLKTDTVNTDHAHQYWVITTGGTSYYFGLNQLPGYASGNATTNSVWTVPVYGNDTGEPCHASTFAASSCATAWRWNLDYVVDRHQDSMSYWYKTEANYYGADNATTPVSYVRGGYLDHVEYGQRAGHTYDTTQPAAGKVFYDVSERCNPTGFTCAGATLSSTTASHWPDVPYDQNCASTGTCNNHGPSFWTTKELTGIRTQVLVGTAYSNVDSWALNYSFPSTGDDTSPSLWLSSVTRTGQVGGTASTPPITFTPRMMANRVPSLAGYLPITRGRIYQISTESGDLIQVNYADTTPTIAACDNGSTPVLPSSDDSNGMLCYPAYWTPPGLTSPIKDWFNKYVVSSVTEQDTATKSPSVETDYSYVGPTAWHYADDPGTQAKYRTWNQFRGFGEVDTRTGTPGGNDPITFNRAIYFRGMDGDKTATGTRSITLNDTAKDDPQKDVNALAGVAFETLAYNGDGGSLLADTVTDPWLGPVTATQSRTAAGLDPLTAQQINSDRVRTTQTTSTGSRTTETDTTFDNASGLPTAVDDHGDTSTTSDDRCTRTTYMKDASGAWLPMPSRTTTVSVACSVTPKYPDNLVADEQVYYDGATTTTAVPTTGDVTKVVKTAVVDSSGNPTSSVTALQATYDQYGRELTSTDGDSRVTTTAYTPTTGAAPTKVVVTSPKVTGQLSGFAATSVMDPTRGETLSTTDAAGYVTSSTYDPMGRLTGVWDPGFSQTANPNQPNTKYSYDLSNTGISTVTTQDLLDNGSYTTSIALYDSLLRQRETQSSTVDGGRDITDTVYDSHGWPIKTDAPYYNNSAPNSTLVAAPDDTVPSSTGYEYDGDGRTLATISYHAGTETWRSTVAYPGEDETVVIPPNGGTKTATYTDARGHTVKLLQYKPTDPNNPLVTQYSYDASDRQVGQQDTATTTVGATIPSHTWSTGYNLLGQKTSSSDPDSGTTSFTYDNAGLLKTATDARGKQLSYTYDELGRKTAQYDTSTTSTESATNELASWKYDSLKKGYLSSSTSYYNSGANAYTEAVSAYDTHGWPRGTAVTIPAGEGNLAGTYSTSVTYNYTGTVASSQDSTTNTNVNLPGETINYSYDAYGHPTGASSTSWDYVDNVAYDDFGNATRLTYGPTTNFAQLGLSYDEQTQRLTEAQVVTGNGGTLADDTTYGYSNADGTVSAGSGLITSITDKQNPGSAQAVTDTQCFGYDFLQRLTSAWTATDACASTPTAGNSPSVGGPNPYWQSWTYDEQGNRLTQVNHDVAGNTANDVTTAYQPVGGTGNTATGTQSGKPVHGLVQAGSSNAAGPIAGSTITYGYDAAGNTTSRTNSATTTDTLTYDATGKLASLSTTGSATETSNYRYDANGQLLVRQDDQATVLYVGDEELTLQKGQTTAVGLRYVGLGGSLVAVHDSTGQVFYTVPNQQGTNTIQISASNTATVNRRSFTPYGQDRTAPSAWMGNKGYVGGQQDETTGLTNLGAREYDPSTGKFLSPDPLIVQGDPQQWNAYSYADDSPVTKSDPTGTRPADCDGACLRNWVAAQRKNLQEQQDHPGQHRCGSDYASWCKTTAQEVALQQQEAEAEAKARAAATAQAALAAAKSHKEGLVHQIISLVGDLIGVTDAVNCFTKGDVMGCISTALTFVPWGKIFKAVKVGVEAFKVWKMIDRAEEVIRGAEDVAKAAEGAAEAVRGEAAAADAALAAETKAENAAADAAKSRGGGDGPSCSIHSFVASTPVLMADGTVKAIATVHSGDVVLATDPQTGISRSEVVVRQIVTKTDREFTELSLRSSTHGAHAPPATAQLTTTWHHPFWNASLHRWTNASELAKGTLLREPDGSTASVVGVRNYHGTAVTYDLTVAELHTYYVLAGDLPILVHNSGGDAWWDTGDDEDDPYAEYDEWGDDASSFEKARHGNNTAANKAGKWAMKQGGVTNKDEARRVHNTMKDGMDGNGNLDKSEITDIARSELGKGCE